MKKTFVGFGFGPIQSALFLFEAYCSGNFGRFVVAEIDPALVDALRKNGGRYTINVAGKDSIRQHVVEGIEMLNPQVPEDRALLIEAIGQSGELATALPSVRYFDVGSDTSVAAILAEGMATRQRSMPMIVYAAENHNQAAELLQKAVGRYLSEEQLQNIQFLNTVVGKMSGVIADEGTIAGRKLETITPDIRRAILVEEFNRILISRILLPDFQRGIDVFLEKDDLLPFEEAKLYGHNAIHALIAYLAELKGMRVISEAAEDSEIMEIAHNAFLKESGEALVKRHEAAGDPLFTAPGYCDYAEDLLTRMVNPNLNDLVDRVARDHLRKLGYDDRLYGTIHLALSYHGRPENMALGAAAGVISLIRRQKELSRTDGVTIPESFETLTRAGLHKMLTGIWKEKMDRHADTMVALTWRGLERLEEFGWV